MPKEVFDVLIVGSGAAGLSAGIYAARYNLKALIIGEEFGGATTTAWTVENYPGYISIDGFDLMMRMKEQAQALGVEVRDGKVTGLRKEGDCFVAITDRGEVGATTVILATGSARRKLNLPNEKELNGKGIHYCTTCDSPLYKGKIIGIVGGGDASVKGANLAAQFAKKIYLITRRKDDLRGEPANLETMKKFGEKIEIVFDTNVKTINGKDRLESISLTKPLNGSDTLVLDGLFVEIGAEPSNVLAKQVGVELDTMGYVEVDPMMRTNVKGVFVAGDVTNETGHFKQDIVSAAQGSIAATSCYEHITTGALACPWHARPVSRDTITKSERAGAVA